MSLRTQMQLYADVRSDERNLVTVLFIHSLLMGFSTSFYLVASNSYFIKKTEVGDIPFAYIIAGIFGYALVSLFKYVQQRSGSIFSFVNVLWVFAAACILLYLGHLQLSETSPATIYLAYAGFIFVFPFANMFVLGFSGICLQLFNLAQSKRLLALIGTGEVIASIIGYITVPFITKFTGSPVHLFLLSAIFIALSAIPILYIYRSKKEKFAIVSRSVKARKFNLALLKKEQFYRSLALVAFFSVLAVYCTDYTYLLSVRQLSAMSGVAIASIVAVLFSVIKAGELIFSLFSANIISRRGMSFSLLLLPLLLAASSLFSFGSHFIFDDALLFMIAFFLVNKWNERVMRKGVYAPSIKVLYQVAEPSERIQLQTSIEGTISQVSIILSGILLLIVSKLSGGKDQSGFFLSMAVISTLSSAIWLLLVYDLYKNYRISIHQYLEKFRRVVVTRQQAGKHKVVEEWLQQQSNTLPEEDFLMLKKAVLQQVGELENLDAKGLWQMILTFNPALQLGSTGDAAMLSRKMLNSFFASEDFFNRLVIIWYLEATGKLNDINTFRELYEAADFAVRREILAALIRMDYKPTMQDRFWFVDQCQQYASEIIWVNIAITDLSDLPDSKLANAMDRFAGDLRHHLLELLKILYDKSSVEVVQQIFAEADKATESQIFAVELLDNILEAGLKETIIPVFEEIPQHMYEVRLQKLFFIYHLPLSERLKEILMKDFKMMAPNIKPIALGYYYNLTKDEVMLKAFLSSLIDELKASALLLRGGPQNEVRSSLKQELIKKLQLENYVNSDYCIYLQRYAIAEKTAPVNTRKSILVASKQLLSYAKLEVAITPHKKLQLDIARLSVLFRLIP